MIENGKDPTRFVFDMIYFLRDLLFYKTAPELADVLEIAIIDEQFKETANNLDAEWIEEAIMKFNDCQQQIKWTNSPKIIIEITLLSIASREKKARSEEHTSELQSRGHLVCRLLLEKKKNETTRNESIYTD